jgi:hypothetical protein
MNLTRPAILFASTIGLAHAQSPLSGLAHGLIIDTPPNGTMVKGKPTGDRPLQDLPIAPNNSAPIYSISALLGNSTLAPQFKMDSMSTGNDNIPVVSQSLNDEHWIVDPSTGGGWAAIAVSVAEVYEATDDPNSAFARRIQDAGPFGRGSDIFSYWFSGNIGLPADLIDTAFFEFGAVNMSLPTSSHVTGLDTYMPAVIDTQGDGTNLVPVTSKWYFTLSQSTVSAIQNNWTTWGSLFSQLPHPSVFRPDLRPVSSSEIGQNYVYMAEWTGSWSKIYKVFTPAELGLVGTDAIDAIAFFDVPNKRNRIVMSLTLNSPSSLTSSGHSEQVLVGGPLLQSNSGPGGHKPLRTIDGQTIPSKIGFTNDTEIDSVCTYDPDVLAIAAFCKWMAMPELGQQPAAIGSSAARFRASNTEDGLLLQATDLPNVSGSVMWEVSVGPRTVSVTRQKTGPRMQTFLRIPTTTTDTIIIKTTFLNSQMVVHGWELKLVD